MVRQSVVQRRNSIVKWVNANGLTQVSALASMFNTSEVTIRKDLLDLSQKGLLIRQFGAAVPISGVTTTTLSESSSLSSPNVPYHNTFAPLGRAAAALVTKGAKVVIDGGTTTLQLIPFLDGIRDVVVMTNSLPVANALTAFESEPTVLMTGGTWDANSQSFQGAMAEQLVSAYSYDIAFIGAAGIDVARGTTTFNELTGVTRAMAQAAKHVVIMASAKKLSHKMPNLELDWKNITTLITDTGISDVDKDNIEKKGVSVITVLRDGE